MLEKRIASWFEEAEHKGVQQGRLEGKSNMLMRLLALRFGPLPEWVERRLTQATEVELEAWADKVLTANALQDVLTEPPAAH